MDMSGRAIKLRCQVDRLVTGKAMASRHVNALIQGRLAAESWLTPPFYIFCWVEKKRHVTKQLGALGSKFVNLFTHRQYSESLSCSTQNLEIPYMPYPPGLRKLVNKPLHHRQ